MKWVLVKRKKPPRSGWCLTLSYYLENGIKSNLIHGIDFFHQETQSFNKESEKDIQIIVQAWMPYPDLPLNASFWTPSVPEQQPNVLLKV